jgi:anaerobic magnesium-protoporphyrin IX monomethyl ester cyclase
MKITLLNVEMEGDNKDYNAGFGTKFRVGKSLRARLLEKIRSKSEKFPIMSYGYLAALFRRNGHQVEVRTNAIPEADLVILQGSTIRHGLELEYIRSIKAQTQSKVGVIGPFPSVMPELFSDADFVIQGEPEEAARNITDRIPEGVVQSKLIMDLDTLPFPDWSVFPLHEFSYRPTINNKPFTFIQSSRGCPYMCNYCPYKLFGEYRQRTPGKVVEEMEYLAGMGVQGVMFRDPMFSLNRQWILELCDGIIARRIGMEWGCETRMDALDAGMLARMYEAGMRAIKVGIESVDGEILGKSGRKPTGAAHQEEIVRYCNRKGIRVVAFYMIGLPDDTREAVMETLRYAKRLNTDYANFTICTPLPGTEFYKEVEQSIYEKDWERFDNFHPVFKHKNMSGKELLELQEKALVSYYYRPKLLFKHLTRILTGSS